MTVKLGRLRGVLEEIIAEEVLAELHSWVRLQESQSWMVGPNVEFVDVDRDVVLRVRLADLVARAILGFAGPRAREEELYVLRASRDELVLCVEMIDCALEGRDSGARDDAEGGADSGSGREKDCRFDLDTVAPAEVGARGTDCRGAGRG